MTHRYILYVRPRWVWRIMGFRRWYHAQKVSVQVAVVSGILTVLGLAVTGGFGIVDIELGKPAAQPSNPDPVLTVTPSVTQSIFHSPSPGRSAPSRTAPGAVSSAPSRTWIETPFTESKTFADFVNAGYPLGAILHPGQAVQVSCRVRGFVVEDGDPWWYRLASPPWDGHYYATSDVFYNTRDTSGNPINGIVVDTRVRLC